MNINKQKKNIQYRTLVALVSISFVIGGCASFSKNSGFNEVQKITQERIKQDVIWAKTDADKSNIADRVQELLQNRIDVESAVQIALLNNKGLQAAFYDLGISEADLVQAGRFPNPKFSMLYARNNGEYKIEQALTFNIFSLITMPKAIEIERKFFEQTKQATALEVLKIANEVRISYFNAVAAIEQFRYSEQVKESAEASAELARRMVKAGNFNQLDQIREQSFYADAALDLANSKNHQFASLEVLSRLLSVPARSLTLEERLPDLPETIDDLQPFEKLAFEQRLDLKAIRIEADALAKQLGLTKTTRFINVLEIGPARVLEGRRGDPYKKGVELSFELPIFDWGTARVARAEAIYMQSINRATQLAINAQSEIREEYNNYRTKYDTTKHIREEIVPLRKRILQQNQLRYNGMLTGPFELFGDARAQVTSIRSYIEALHAFWVADARLQMSLIANPNMKEGK